MHLKMCNHMPPSAYANVFVPMAVCSAVCDLRQSNHIMKVNLQEYVQPLYMQRYKVVYKFCRWISIVSQSLVTLVGIDVVEAVTAFSLCDSKLHCAIYYS